MFIVDEEKELVNLRYVKRIRKYHKTDYTYDIRAYLNNGDSVVLYSGFEEPEDADKKMAEIRQMLSTDNLICWL